MFFGVDDPGALPDDEGWVVSLDLDAEDAGLRLMRASGNDVAFESASLSFNDGSSVTFGPGRLHVDIHRARGTRGEVFTE